MLHSKEHFLEIHFVLKDNDLTLSLHRNPNGNKHIKMNLTDTNILWDRTNIERQQTIKRNLFLLVFHLRGSFS